jgi:hypothetical protein
MVNLYLLSISNLALTVVAYRLRSDYSLVSQITSLLHFRPKMATQNQKLFAITIFGYKKDSMSEEEYHDYISNTHAGHLKALLAKNDIVSYTMVSRSSSHCQSFLIPLTATQYRRGRCSN